MDTDDAKWQLKIWALKFRLAIGTLGIIAALAGFALGAYAFFTNEKSYFGIEVGAFEVGSLYLAPPLVVGIGSIFVMVGGVALALKWT